MVAGPWDNVQLPSPPNGPAYLQAWANLANTGSGLVDNAVKAYQRGQDFQYQQKQRNLFDSPDKQALLQQAIQSGNYAPLLQTLMQSGGAGPTAQLIPELIKLEGQRGFYSDLTGGGGGAAPGPGIGTSGVQPNTVPRDQSPAALQRASDGLSATGSDNAGGETIQSLTAGIASGRGIGDVSPQQMQGFARALNVDLDTPLSAQQEAIARKLIGTNIGRGGNTQSAPPPTRDAASSGSPVRAGINQGNEPPAGSGPDSGPISPAPTTAAGGGAFRATPLGTLQDARAEDEKAQRYARAAARPGISAEQSKAALNLADQAQRRAEEIRRGLNQYNSPETNPAIKGQIGQFEEASKAIGKHVGEIIEAGGRNAYKRIQLLDTVGEALRQGGGNITTGPFAKSALALKQAISSAFSVEIPGTAEAEVAQKTGFALASAAVKEITSRPTQREVTLALENNPGMLLTQKGSFFMIDIMKQAARQDAELSKLAGRKSNWGNWSEVEDNFYRTHPLMSPFDHRRPLGIEDINALGGGGPGGPPGGAPSAPAAGLPRGVRSIQVVP